MTEAELLALKAYIDAESNPESRDSQVSERLWDLFFKLVMMKPLLRR